jgi:hypothetical protein
MLFLGRPALSRSRTVTFVRTRRSSSTSRSLALESRTWTLLRRAGAIENLVDPSFSMRLRTDGETGLAVSSSSLPVQRRAPAHLSEIAATPALVSVIARPAIRTTDGALRFARPAGFTGRAPEVVGGAGALTVTPTVLEPLRPAELVMVSVAV